MFHPAYEPIVQFASEGDLKEELALARKEYETRTGELFESDPSFERRIASFLEWYVLDRPVSFASHLTPAKMYIETKVDDLTTPEVTELRQLTKTVLSVFEFKGLKKETMRLVDVLTNAKHKVFERRKLAGLNSGDLLEARLVPKGDQLMVSDCMTVHPRDARKAILKATKLFRKSENTNGRIDMVHKIAFLSHRCERYGHVDPKTIFAELAS